MRVTLIGLILLMMASALSVPAKQSRVFERRIANAGELRVMNNFGRVSVESAPSITEISIEASSPDGVVESEIVIERKSSSVQIQIVTRNQKKRVDLKITIPINRAVDIETTEGEIKISGIFTSVSARSATGSIVTDVPLSGTPYRFTWMGSRPRVVSKETLARPRELTGGRHEISGRFSSWISRSDSSVATMGPSKLELSTLRGVMLINVTLSDAPSEIGDRPLSPLAKKIIMSGDSVLTESIRRAAPDAFAEFSSGLRGNRTAPSFAKGASQSKIRQGTVIVQVVDSENRAVGGLSTEDFDVFVGDTKVEIESVAVQTEPFDVVLLLDVSGSVDDYLDFVRNAAGSFLDTVSERDRVAIYSFNEDLKRLSDFSKDRPTLAATLFELEAGGGTALYDSIGFILADAIPRSMSERTAIIVFSDGDDNKSFVNFNSLGGVIEESNTLIYPLYVPTGLALASRRDANEDALDPSRTRYMTLTSKAESEGERLARLSGGVYYPIKRVDEIQKAYDDIVSRLRNSYTVTYKPVRNLDAELQSRRLRVEVKRKNVTVAFRGAPAVLSR